MSDLDKVRESLEGVHAQLRKQLDASVLYPHQIAGIKASTGKDSRTRDRMENFEEYEDYPEE